MLLAASHGQAATGFRFEEQTSVDEMRARIRRDFSEASTRDQVRTVFVAEGGATLKSHPRKGDVEKYIYDINLCGYYVWRWNVSADYRADGRLKQLYVNAEPVLGGAEPADPPKKGPFYRSDRPRPQAFKGEASLAVIFADRDADPKTPDDQDILTGVGPTRADPLNLGRAYPYRGEVWRSIFDGDDARVVVPYAGDCAAVDASILQQLGAAATPMMRSSPSTGGAVQNAPRPTTLDEAGVKSWLASHIRSDGWTLITADGAAVSFGGPAGVARLADGTLSALVRHEYYAPAPFGDVTSQSNLQSWNVDCKGRRMRVLTFAMFEGSNLSGPSWARASAQPAWDEVEADSPRGRAVKRICEAPATGQPLT
ncbi:MAG: hypothetical protein A2790_11375 [Phenylobacterium sp. RIFCSPHIGHO2_01_FULL_69_31]|uniref:surface-adhesin E family protein n=1 Tax=Phenylobacterium sp. RIFCSPHIGHO2_01_FULL_69_31 TaxID=1801944 RepID=UPI0008C6D8D1|nr:surface-adhesin E family protein [Phenylobacterium sp. RIFCSPHIGHO2_01_FULL_69_31]OHB28020.1 MAG: hypothetical protein A2790_11375 [Phenylobacterium sp. RIFCSPHIGHO2_01_FULL_69_31]